MAIRQDLLYNNLVMPHTIVITPTHTMMLTNPILSIVLSIVFGVRRKIRAVKWYNQVINRVAITVIRFMWIVSRMAVCITKRGQHAVLPTPKAPVIVVKRQM